MTIRVHIERVVLHDVAAGHADRGRWGEQLERDLAARLAALPGLSDRPWQAGAVTEIPAVTYHPDGDMHGPRDGGHAGGTHPDGSDRGSGGVAPLTGLPPASRIAGALAAGLAPATTERP